MKFKYLFLSLMILILASSIALVAAEEASLGDYSFNVPDGYEIVNQTDNLVSMQSDPDHAIVMSLPDEVKSAADFKKSLEAEGYKFGDEDTYKAGDFDVSQYNYEYQDYQGFLYICEGEDNPILITLVMPADEDAPSPDDNPVTEIINSLDD